MPIEQLLKLQEKYDIIVTEDKQDLGNIKSTHACFTGTPRKHPEREDRIILVTDMFDTQPTYFEFLLNDISYVERLSNQVNENGETAAKARIWIKKGSIGVRCIPFVIDQISMTDLV